MVFVTRPVGRAATRLRVDQDNFERHGRADERTRQENAASAGAHDRHVAGLLMRHDVLLGLRTLV